MAGLLLLSPLLSYSYSKKPIPVREGTARWRSRLKEENPDKVIVFVGELYGVFHLAELAILTHLPLRRLPTHLGSAQAVLQRYGISP